MKKTKIILGVILIFLLVCFVRIIYLNTVSEHIKVQEYKVGEKVDYGEDFFYNSDENCNGYQIMVNSSKIYNYSDYVKEFNLKSENANNTKYVYDVVLTIWNANNEDGAINIIDTYLYSKNVRLSIDSELWASLYPQLSDVLYFKLQKNTSKEFHFPYILENEDDAQVYTLDKLKSNNFYLNVTQYPIKKIIKVND